MFTPLSLYNSFSSLVNTQQGSWFRPQTDFIVQANDVSIELWDYLTRKSEKSQQERDYLRPFLKSKQGVVKAQKSSYGILDFPKDYDRFSAARLIVHRSTQTVLVDKNVDDGKCYNDELFSQQEVNESYYNDIREIQIDLVDDAKWAACLQHLTKYPTLDAPKMLEINGSFRVSPRSVSVVVLDYYVRPKEAEYKFTVAPGNVQTGAGDDIIYDTTSQPFEWPETVKPIFIWKLAKRYGVFVDKEKLFGIGQAELASM